MRYRLEYWTNLRECHGTNVGGWVGIDLNTEEYELLMEKLDTINAADDVLEAMRNELPVDLAEKLIRKIEEDYKDLEWSNYQADFEIDNDDEEEPDYDDFEDQFADFEYTIVEFGVEKW